MIPEQLALLLIKQKNHNKRFGEFKFEYFGGSDVVNNILEMMGLRVKKEALDAIIAEVDEDGKKFDSLFIIMNFGHLFKVKKI